MDTPQKHSNTEQADGHQSSPHGSTPLQVESITNEWNTACLTP